jgi:hypothetical protein
MQRDYNPFVKNSCERDLELESRFYSLNKEYFEDKLPRYQILICSKSKNFSHLSAGYCSTNDRRIFLRSGISKNSILQTLTHEMIHAKLWWLTKNTHGKTFIKELRRVRKLGAPLSPLELDLAEGFVPPKLTKRSIESAIYEALVTERLPRKFISRFLEREFYLPYSEIKHIVDVPRIIAKIHQFN